MRARSAWLWLLLFAFVGGAAWSGFARVEQQARSDDHDCDRGADADESLQVHVGLPLRWCYPQAGSRPVRWCGVYLDSMLAMNTMIAITPTAAAMAA